jgi:hypothetical protein
MKPSSKDIEMLRVLECEIDRAKQDYNPEAIEFLRVCLESVARRAPLDDLIAMSEFVADFIRRNISRGVLLSTEE